MIRWGFCNLSSVGWKNYIKWACLNSRIHSRWPVELSGYYLRLDICCVKGQWKFFWGNKARDWNSIAVCFCVELIIGSIYLYISSVSCMCLVRNRIVRYSSFINCQYFILNSIFCSWIYILFFGYWVKWFFFNISWELLYNVISESSLGPYYFSWIRYFFSIIWEWILLCLKCKKLKRFLDVSYIWYSLRVSRICWRSL